MAISVFLPPAFSDVDARLPVPISAGFSVFQKRCPTSKARK
jgi:hypothetical protein